MTNDGRYAAIKSNFTKNIEIFDIKTREMMLPIEAHMSPIGERHLHNYVSCYFIENNKALSIDSEEIICWDINDMKDWNKLFQVKSKNIKPILDSNLKLKGLVIDAKVRLLADVLYDLCDDKTQFIG
jgi:hypothetical protein